MIDGRRLMLAGAAFACLGAASTRPQDVSLVVSFKPGPIRCVRAPCPGSGLAPVTATAIKPHAIHLTRSELVLAGVRLQRHEIQRIAINGGRPRDAWSHPQPPEDMVAWRGGGRSFGPLTIAAGEVLQPGQRRRPLGEAEEISLAEPRPETVKPVTLKIGELKRGRDAAGRTWSDHWDCWVDLSGIAQQQYATLRRQALASAQAKAAPVETYWAEFRGANRFGKRYGPAGWHLCQIDAVEVLSLKWRLTSKGDER